MAVDVPVFLAVASGYVATRLLDAGPGSERLPLRSVSNGSISLLRIGLVAMSTIGYIYAFTGTFKPAIPQELGAWVNLTTTSLASREDADALEHLDFLCYLPFDRFLPCLCRLARPTSLPANIPAPLPGTGETMAPASRFVVAELDKSRSSPCTAIGCSSGSLFSGTLATCRPAPAPESPPGLPG